jgi:hypothetical protein
METTRHYTTDEIRLIVSMSAAAAGGKDIDELLKELRGVRERDEERKDDVHKAILVEGVHYVREEETIRYTSAGLRSILQHLR